MMNAISRTASSALLGLALTFSVAACGPEAAPPKVAKVSPGSMPDGGSWTGVYYSPLFGSLHLVGEGKLVQGKWLRPLKGRWGKLQGNADGNLLRFDWSEHTDGLVGPNAKKSGKGYFVYSRPEGANVDDQIKGSIGRGKDEVGVEWRAIKQRNVKPDLKSIGGGGASDLGGGDWDSKNSESDKPEKPAEPDDEGGATID